MQQTPCILQRTLQVPGGSPKLILAIGYLRYRFWRLQIFVDDENITTQTIGTEEAVNTKDVPPNAAFAVYNWTTVDVDLSKYKGKTVILRLYHGLPENALSSFLTPSTLGKESGPILVSRTVKPRSVRCRDTK